MDSTGLSWRTLEQICQPDGRSPLRITVNCCVYHIYRNSHFPHRMSFLRVFRLLLWFGWGFHSVGILFHRNVADRLLSDATSYRKRSQFSVSSMGVLYRTFKNKSCVAVVCMLRGFQIMTLRMCLWKPVGLHSFSAYAWPMQSRKQNIVNNTRPCLSENSLGCLPKIWFYCWKHGYYQPET